MDNLESRRLLAVPALSIDSTHRRIVDDAGNAVFFQGDTAWSILTGATYAEADAYLTDRAARGVNVIVVNLVEALFNGPVNQNGDGPFLVEDDFSTPNEAYFAHADRVLSRAEELGLYILLAPAYLGFPDTDSGWYDAILASGEDKMRGYGEFVGNRYKNYSNIIWMQGGDSNPRDAVDEVNALVAGIKSTGDTHLQTAHAQPDFSPVDIYDEPWLDFSNVYTYTPTYTRAEIEYTSTPTRPMFLIEDRYEGMGSTTLLRRANKYWTILSGGFGAVMGNDPIWRMGAGWTSEFDSPLAQDMSRLGSFFRSIDWDELQPAFGNELIVAGQGVKGSDDFVTAAFTDDRELTLAYFSASRTISMNLSQMAGTIVAQWWDPTSGAFQPAGTVSAAAAVSFTPPGLNSAGETDWMLVLNGEDVAPTVKWINFEVDLPAPSITARFSEFVGDSLDVSDFEIVHVATGQTIPASSMSLQYFYDQHRIALSLPKRLADGQYAVRLIADGVRDRSATPLAADVVYSFSFLAGDANRDRTVNFDDLLILGQNFGQQGKSFSQGNFDFDEAGAVTFDDLLLLAQRYGQSVLSQPPAVTLMMKKRRPAGDLFTSSDVITKR